MCCAWSNDPLRHLEKATGGRGGPPETAAEAERREDLAVGGDDFAAAEAVGGAEGRRRRQTRRLWQPFLVDFWSIFEPRIGAADGRGLGLGSGKVNLGFEAKRRIEELEQKLMEVRRVEKSIGKKEEK